MADRWYYAHDDNKVGPYSAQELKELAAAGKILPTDTVWKEGVEKGVLASRVKNLFAPAGADVSPPPAPSPVPPAAPPSSEQPPVPFETAPPSAEAPPAPVESEAEKPAAAGAGDPESKPEEAAPVKPSQRQAGRNPTKKGRAVAGKGAMISGQNGTTVQFRKKCTVCGHEDSARSTIPIRHGLMRVGYFCPKCRRLRQVELQGFLQ
jgi:hypothetical protein